MTQRPASRISNVNVVAGQQPVSYYFAEADDISNLHNAQRRFDLPRGTLPPGKEFKFQHTATSTDPEKSICVITRGQSGELVGAACNANGVMLRSVSENTAPRRSAALGRFSGKSKVFTIADLPKEDAEIRVRHVMEDENRGNLGKFLFLLLFFIIAFILVRKFLR